ncbi:protein of unknown function [Beijerinckiaceae bacterium RH AL1]|nr:formylglycine-generating enzyme family protein [Beijerinckiaceae bacterium]VVB45662.1 protein of unknown function [Beijerinckiaceae bacterium RH CH11]VVB45737.1 protein of unknown function [Beijerinckiaceae bacterium RH AL8]VVC54977.1 protein of unknown function [Beijerinckiaceae bacterium RH AL1]
MGVRGPRRLDDDLCLGRRDRLHEGELRRRPRLVLRREDGPPPRHAAVGHYAPNNWGLYDVDGNVWQWCEDAWHPDYTGAPVDGTAWPGGDETMALLRGGAWNYDASGLRIADRNWYPRSLSTSFIGFRVVTPLDDTIAKLGE